MGLTTGAITTVLDRLERAGFARRARDESDRRRVRVTLTEKAHQELWPYYEPLLRMSEQLYARYTDDELGCCCASWRTRPSSTRASSRS